MKPNLTFTQRFWKHVQKGLSCWLWTACKTKDGYGRLGNSKQGQYLAHRLSYRIHFGDTPEGMEVCHSCDTPACVNPSHLWIGTHSDNMKDCARKGRRILPCSESRVRGISHPKSKLTDEQVREILCRYQHGESPTKMGPHFPVSIATINRIVNRKIWRHISL